MSLTDAARYDELPTDADQIEVRITRTATGNVTAPWRRLASPERLYSGYRGRSRSSLSQGRISPDITELQDLEAQHSRSSSRSLLRLSIDRQREHYDNRDTLTNEYARTAPEYESESTSIPRSSTTISRAPKLEPILPPDGSAPLDWRPLTLTTGMFCFNAAYCAAVAGGILALILRENRPIYMTNENAHFASTYAPSTIATIATILFRSTTSESFRLLPYFRMADVHGSITARASAARSVAGICFPMPFAAYWDDMILKVPMQILISLVGFLTASKSIILGSERSADGWTLTVHVRPAYYLVAAFTGLAIYYLALLCSFRGYASGLKNDPCTMLDQLALVYNTNALSHFVRLRYNYERAWKTMASTGSWRLGYWRQAILAPATDSDPDEQRTKVSSRIVYGIASSSQGCR
ncbi:hypothetical protein LTR66_017752 [Elasticomyces elasticus]|nr:hypothetical protein LTR66_017752 [Elasticomyces elasticus]